MKLLFSFLMISWVMVALVLHVLDRPDSLPQVVEILEEILEPLRPLDDVLRRFLEENEELLVPRNDPEHHPSPAMRARAASAPETRSSRISRTGWIFFTNATLWPAMSDPCSTSPSTTARRSAPTQNSSSLTCASSRGTSPAFTLPSRSNWSRLKSFVPSLMIARTGIVGSDGSNWVVGMASRADARTNASLNLGARRILGDDEPGPELDPGGSQRKILGDDLPGADPARHEHGDLRDVQEEFLRQDGGGDGADVTAGLVPLDHEGVDPLLDEAFRQREDGGEADHLQPGRLHFRDVAPRGDASGEEDELGTSPGRRPPPAA